MLRFPRAFVGRTCTVVAAGWNGARARWLARPLLPRLRSAGDGLADLSAEIEERFLRCGQALQNQVTLTSRLTALGAQMITRDDRVRLGGAAVQRVAQMSSTQLELGRQFADEVERLGQILDHHAGRLQHLHTEQQQIERSFAPIRALQSFFRIESATLANGTQTLFHGLAQEMTRLETEVHASFAAQDEAFATTRLRVQKTAEALHAAAARQMALATTKRAEVDAARSRLEAEFAAEHQRDLHLQQAIRAIERETDAIVVGLQYQDITRQRLEHVQTAAHDLCADPGSSTESARAEARRRQVLCRIQTVQLRAVQDDLEHAAGTVAGGLRSVLGRLEEIERECLSVASLEKLTAGMDAVAAETIGAHQISTGLMNDSLATLDEAIGETRGFAAATTGASDAMRRLAQDIHWMGLNAQVQAVHANSGSLEVLSRAASQISQEAQTLSARFEQQLLTISAELNGLVRRSEEFREATRGRLAGVQQESAALLAELQAEHQQTKASVQEVAQVLQQLGAQADDLLGSVDLADFSRDAIAATLRLFSELAAVYARASGGEVQGDDPLMTQALARYTMESERTAHLIAVAEQEANTPAPAPGAAPAADAAAPAPAPAAARGTDPTPAAASGSALGDNVELF